MPISWEYYTKRRRLDVVAWLRNKKISTYTELEAECKRRSITPPQEDVVKDLLLAANTKLPKSKPSNPAPHQVPKHRPEPKPVPKQPVKVPPVRKKPEPKTPAPMIKPFVAETVSKPKPKTDEVKSIPEPAPVPIAKEPEKPKKFKKIVWNFMMKKSQLLELAQSVGIEELSSKSTKAQIVGSLVKAGHPESQT